MYKSTAVFGILFFLASTVVGQKFSFGRCPKVDTQTTVDISQYLGKWYEITKIPNWFQKGDCGQAEYSLMNNGHIKVDNREVVNGDKNDAVGEAYRPDDNQQGKLKVRFSKFSPWGDYWIVDTDYTDYTLVYSCSDFVFVKWTYGWILSRQRTLDQAKVDTLLNKLKAFGVDTAPFKKSNQQNCPNIL